MSGLFNLQDSLYPGDNFVTGWIRRFIEIDDTAFNVVLQISLNGVHPTGIGVKWQNGRATCRNSSATMATLKCPALECSFQEQS